VSVDKIIDDIIKREGGFVDNPADRGGPTKYGITQMTLAETRGHPVTRQDVADLTIDEARTIYRRKYVEKPGFTSISEPLLDLIVDTGVHSGVETAVRLLQKVLDITPRDGILGPKTQAVIQRANTDLLYRKFLAERIRFLGRLIEARRENAEFAGGWMNRVANFVDGTA